MAAELGDMVAADGRAGELVDIDLATGRAVVRPFPIAEQADWPGQPECFTAQGELRVIKKHWEWENSVAREREQLAERARARNEAIRAEHYERAARDDRAWYRERER